MEIKNFIDLLLEIGVVQLGLPERHKDCTVYWYINPESGRTAELVISEGIITEHNAKFIWNKLQIGQDFPQLYFNMHLLNK